MFRKGTIMTETSGKNEEEKKGAARITVTENGPYIVTGRIPLIRMEICNDEEGYCRSWRVAEEYPLQEQYALCRCGQSKSKPFCDGSHAKARFNGIETAGTEPYLRHPRIIRGMALDLLDYENLCVHARFCMRAGGIWGLTEHSGNPAARETAIEEAGNCPSGRLVLKDRETGKTIEPDLEKSIVVIEYPPRGEHGPLWVRGGIPVFSASGKQYTVRNRMTLCRCGRSHNKPFCDGSHVQH